MSNDQAVEQEIQEKGLTAPRITVDHIFALMNRVTFRFEQQAGTTSTFCHAYLDDAFYLATGHSACVSLENFDRDLGQSIAERNARELASKRLWELEGYRLYAQLNGEKPIT